MELIVGCRNKAELRELEKFLSFFQILKLTSQISDLAVSLLRQYRLSHGPLDTGCVDRGDSTRAKHGLHHQNQRDYRFIEGLNLLSYS